MTELTFILHKGERLIADASHIKYAGSNLITTGIVTGAGFSRNVAFGTGLFSSQQTKREGSVFDSKKVHLYLTNKRIIFCNAKISLWSGEESIGTLLSEIGYENIKGISASSKFDNPAIDISVGSQGGIENIKFWFFGSRNGEKREKERNEFLSLIKKQTISRKG